MNDKYLTVSAINSYLRYKFTHDENLKDVYIKGEISNFKLHNSGHLYFTLKDQTSRINAVMFRDNANNLTFEIQDGMNVLIKGNVNIYENGGNYQIYVDEILEDGKGSLYLALEQLKDKLNKKGLFNIEHKLKKPSIPKKIGIITAPTGAAIKDIITTIKRRFPMCETLLFPTLVQGKEAAINISENIKKAENYDLDLLIIGRGGGSIEDLWAFNEEIVAYAIYECSIPIISAVGHEIDTTISDYVADYRAATPTAAAEIAVPDISDLLNTITSYKVIGTNLVKSIIFKYEERLKNIKKSYIFKRPMSIYEIKEQRLDNIVTRMNTYINNYIELKNSELNTFKNKYLLKNPEIIYQKQEQIIVNIIGKLEILNPINTLKRGYSITKKGDIYIFDVKDISINDEITVKLSNGNIISKVTKVEVK